MLIEEEHEIHLGHLTLGSLCTGMNHSHCDISYCICNVYLNVHPGYSTYTRKCGLPYLNNIPIKWLTSPRSFHIIVQLM